MPDAQRRRIATRLSFIARWRILDNLRRSLVEPATFLLLLFGWLILPGNPLYWTLATIGILFVPADVLGVASLVLLLRAPDHLTRR